MADPISADAPLPDLKAAAPSLGAAGLVLGGITALLKVALDPNALDKLRPAGDREHFRQAARAEGLIK